MKIPYDSIQVSPLLKLKWGNKKAQISLSYKSAASACILGSASYFALES